MKIFQRISFVLISVLLVSGSFAQSTSILLQKAFQQFEEDAQLRNAISSLYVIDAKTGRVVFDKNSNVGLAPASTQKIITSVTAFEILGKDYRYKTSLGYSGKIQNGILTGDLIIDGSGDPTLASWRYDHRKEADVLQKWISDLKARGVKRINGRVMVNGKKSWPGQFTPDGWIWQDIGNYYGVGANLINWHENQYDMVLRSGNERGQEVEILRTEPALKNVVFKNELSTGLKGSGDNAYIFLAPNSTSGIVNGTIPPGETKFVISGSMPSPSLQAVAALQGELVKAGIGVRAIDTPEVQAYYEGFTSLSSYDSPALDSIIYWFNKKSINLYGEALIKTMALKKTGFASTDSGVVTVQQYWKQQGLDENELNISDGSGLSPLNRVTTHAQVEILKYAKTRDWFADFYNALPEYNSMKMKSGTIRDVKGFCGYHKAKDGNEYIFSFLVNNYNGSASALVGKMYKVLDILK